MELRRNQTILGSSLIHATLLGGLHVIYAGASHNNSPCAWLMRRGSRVGVSTALSVKLCYLSRRARGVSCDGRWRSLAPQPPRPRQAQVILVEPIRHSGVPRDIIRPVSQVGLAECGLKPSAHPRFRPTGRRPASHIFRAHEVRANSHEQRQRLS
jgi:hypothetical protein